ncbi:MAG: hypothetical protein LPK12_08180, partial [Rhodobacterales bacterium]|nr:hypothetical protein [Rhodobacterales bacterium]MDX5499953.1 hypothetical protein [Rhodobacterales bacterium]
VSLHQGLLGFFAASVCIIPASVPVRLPSWLEDIWPSNRGTSWARIRYFRTILNIRDVAHGFDIYGKYMFGAALAAGGSRQICRFFPHDSGISIRDF